MDFVIGIGAVIAVAAALYLASGRLTWRVHSRFLTTARALLALAIAVILVGAAVYKLSSSRTFQVVGPLVPRVDTADKVVALTLDDGPTREYADEVLALLREKDVSATFYLTGRESEAAPEAVRAIVDAGHEIGNHTYSHRRMIFIGGSEVAEELETTDALFEAAGYEGPTTFRPPGCKRLFTLPLVLAHDGRTTVTWDLEPDSGPLANDADAMVEQVARDVRPGSIILMHVMYESRQPSREALPALIDRLQAQGYRFVTVSELIEAESAD